MRSTVHMDHCLWKWQLVLIHEACKLATDVFSLFLFLGVQFVCVLFVCSFVVLEKHCI